MEPGPAESPNKPRKGALREWAETIVIALLVALVLRAFVVQVYLVEGESMEPTLHTAERVLVNKFLYYFRPPAPGEVIVLHDPNQPSRELIKRVIALAGEEVDVRQGVTYINGKPLGEPFINQPWTQHRDTTPVVVPEGYLYVMGDNRGYSLDSRMMGPIPLDQVEGRAFLVFWPPGRFGAHDLAVPRTYK